MFALLLRGFLYHCHWLSGASGRSERVCGVRCPEFSGAGGGFDCAEGGSNIGQLPYFGAKEIRRRYTDCSMCF